MRLALVCSLLLCLCAPSLARQEPLPTQKTVTLKEDNRLWTVDGRVTIENATSVASLRATRIEGRGKDNVIVVSGALELKAVTGGKVFLDNVWIELAPDARSLYLSQCEFKGGGVRTAEGGSTAPKLFMEYTDFGADASFTLTLKAGSLDFQNSSCAQPLVIKGQPFAEKTPNKTKVNVLTCTNEARGLHSGLDVSGIADVQVRNSLLRGAVTRFADCPKLDFDGNSAHSIKLQFWQSSYGSFGGTKIHNCDFKAGKLEFRTPAQEKKVERLTIDHCWFGGSTEPADISKRMLVDNSNDATVGVLIGLSRISAAPLGLAERPQY